MARQDSTESKTTRTRKTAAQRAQESVAKAQKALDNATKRVERATEKVNSITTEQQEAIAAQEAAQRELDYANANPALPAEEPTPVPVDDAGTVTDGTGAAE